jgi:hypothetical protein
MKELKDALNAEFARVLGASHDWMSVIAGVVGRRASEFARTKNGLLEDVVTDVSGDIIIQATQGRLHAAVIRAKEASSTNDELVNNLRHVIMRAAYFRASDAMKWKYRTRTQFSQIGEENGFGDTVEARPEPESDLDLSNYTDLLVQELEVMAAAAEWQSKHRLAARYRRAKEMVPDRIDGMAMGGLMEKYDIRSKGTMQLHLNDIGQALARVAGRLGDPTLVRGTKGIEVA